MIYKLLLGLFNSKVCPVPQNPDEPSSVVVITSQNGIDLIKSFEGLKLRAYKPHPMDVWTIGYGHTKTAKRGQIISKARAERLLRDHDLPEYEQAVRRYVEVPITQQQFDALVSFSYNVGVGAFSKSTLLKKLNKGDYDAAAAQFKRWNKSAGKVFAGLTRRRKAEAEMFLA